MFWYQFQLFLILKNWFNFSFFSFLSLGTAAQKVGRKREKKYPSWSQHIKKIKNNVQRWWSELKWEGGEIERVAKKFKG